MKRVIVIFCALMVGFSLIPLEVHAQAVLGACTDEAVAARRLGKASPAEPALATGGACESSCVPLPGEPAIDFQLPAVVGDEIKMVKLSDYQGKYRVLCFYPADFTIV
jgi:peroxiredoxin (alkyl hydroperoxide reductase subunit C)